MRGETMRRLERMRASHHRARTELRCVEERVNSEDLCLVTSLACGSCCARCVSLHTILLDEARQPRRRSPCRSADTLLVTPIHGCPPPLLSRMMSLLHTRPPFA